MITIDEIKQLAAESYKLPLTGDAYADKMGEWCADIKNSGEHMWWGQKQPYYVFLYKLAKLFHGGVAVEVGTFQGIGFAHLAAGAIASGDKNSWTVGIDKDNHAPPQETAEHYERTRFLNGLSTDYAVIKEIEMLCAIYKIGIKILFIDATHTIWWVKEEIYRLRHLFADQLVIVMDDVIAADNNTLLPKCFEDLPGIKTTFPNLHTDNCIGVAIVNRTDFDNWGPQPVEHLTY